MSTKKHSREYILFKDILKQLRIEKGLTQKEVAQHFGIAQSNYQQWESGKRSPSGETLEKLADFFKVSTDFLLGRNPVERVGLDKFIEELERRYDDVIVLSFMNSDFLSFCNIIEEIALNSLREALGLKMNKEIIEEYSSAGYKRQEYLSNFKEQIDDETIKATEIPNLKKTIIQNEQELASKYFE